MGLSFRYHTRPVCHRFRPTGVLCCCLRMFRLILTYFAVKMISKKLFKIYKRQVISQQVQKKKPRMRCNLIFITGTLKIVLKSIFLQCSSEISNFRVWCLFWKIWNRQFFCLLSHCFILFTVFLIPKSRHKFRYFHTWTIKLNILKIYQF